MADRTAIEWTDATWNPIRGCSRVSAGCLNCYAERVAVRFCGAGQPYEGLIHPTTGSWNGRIRLVPEVLGQPWCWVRPRRIFVNSMSDLFHESIPFEFIATVFFIMSITTRHTYQVLTKRPDRMLEFFDWVRAGNSVFPADRITDIALDTPAIKALGWTPVSTHRGGYDNCGPGWPYENVWLGVSIEDQASADERIPILMHCPAAVRWISAEPLLGRVDLCDHFGMWWNSTMQCWEGTGSEINRHHDGRPRIGWLVAGGESGHGARPMHPVWARSLRDQCAGAGVPFLFKQWGEWAPAQVGAGGDLGGDLRRGTVRHLHAPGNPEGHFRAGDAYVRRVGKKVAGRLLDGVEHNGYPEVCHG